MRDFSRFINKKSFTCTEKVFLSARVTVYTYLSVILGEWVAHTSSALLTVLSFKYFLHAKMTSWI